MNLLFLNALKGLKRKKVQMLGIIMMVMLSTGIYTAMNLALDRMEDRYYTYLDEQNVENISFNSYIDYTKDVTTTDISYLFDNNFKNITEEERNNLIKYTCILDMKTCTIDYTNLPSINEQFITNIKNIFEKYNANIYIEKKKIDSIKDKYNFNYELNKSKIIKEDKTYIKIIPYNKDLKINKVYSVKGNYPTNDNEITMLPKYASIYNIKIGDYYKINEKEYKVVGFTYAPDYIYPLVSYSSPIYDEKQNNIVFTNEETYNNIIGVEEKLYSLKYNYDISRVFELTENTNNEMTKMFEEEKDKIYIDTSTYIRIARISALQLEFKTDRLFAKYFLYLLLTVSVLIIIIITKKRIDNEKMQIGVLKSLGYSRFSIAISYLVYPILGSLIGGILGYIIGVIAHFPLTKLYVSYFVLPLSNFNLNINYLLECIFIPMIFLSILCYMIAIIMLKQKPLKLLKEGSNLKVNVFSKITNKLTSKLSFKYKFKYSLAFRSIPKLLIVALTSFLTGMLIVLTIIGSNLMNGMVDKTFDAINYKYSVSTNDIDKVYNDSEYSLNKTLKLININNLKIEKDISVTGLDIDAEYTKILDKNNKNILYKLNNNDVVISKNMSELLGINIGDKLTYKINNNEFIYNVVDISDEFMSLTMYVNRNILSKDLGYEKNIYNTIMSNNDSFNNLSKMNKDDVNDILNVISVDDLRNNVENQIEKYNASIYIVILFASIMALIIIAVIANIVVEENKKIISLMKIMGYKNNQISNIVLNIYTPVIIVSYLLSIPVMIQLLKKIVSVLSGDLSMTIPISLSPFLAIIGLIGLLIAYYIAIYLSKRVLNKIPLAVALKRE